MCRYTYKNIIRPYLDFFQPKPDRIFTGSSKIDFCFNSIKVSIKYIPNCTIITKWKLFSPYTYLNLLHQKLFLLNSIFVWQTPLSKELAYCSAKWSDKQHLRPISTSSASSILKTFFWDHPKGYQGQLLSLHQNKPDKKVLVVAQAFFSA